jgi:ankyrin repeat protein
MRGRLDGVREELSSENVNYNDMNVGTPLYLAAKGGHANIVALLLTHENIRVNSVYDDKTPLFQAAKRGYTNIVTLLLAHKDILVNLGRYDQAPLSVALHNGHKDIAKLLILRDDIDVNRIKLGGRDALLWAASEGHADIVKLLLPKCNVNWEEKNRYIQRNRFNRFDQENGYNQRLVAAIMNLDDPDATTRFLMELSTRRPDRTPLSWAAENGYEILTRFLLFEEWANLNTRDNGGRTPLSRAAASGYRSVVELLLTKEDIDINARDCDGQTPLSQAAVNGYEEVVKLLLAKENIDVNTKDEHGQTPLSRVAGEGRQEIVQLFLMNERTSLNVRDVDGRTPLSLAAENGHEVIVELLLGKNAAKISKEEMKWKSEEEKFLLTRSGADPNIKDNGGQTPLSWAIDNGHKAIIKLLVPIDATTLFLLTQKGKRRAVKSLILAESNIDERNGHGQTPLHTAILSGHLEIAKDLILYGAEIDLQDNDNMTPLQLAMREKDDRFIQELLKHKADMKNIMAKEWRNAYGKESKDIVLLSETVNGERWVDFPTALPTANELSQAPFGINRHL